MEKDRKKFVLIPEEEYERLLLLEKEIYTNYLERNSVIIDNKLLHDETYDAFEKCVEEELKRLKKTDSD